MSSVESSAGAVSIQVISFLVPTSSLQDRDNPSAKSPTRHNLHRIELSHTQSHACTHVFLGRFYTPGFRTPIFLKVFFPTRQPEVQSWTFCCLLLGQLVIDPCSSFLVALVLRKNGYCPKKCNGGILGPARTCELHLTHNKRRRHVMLSMSSSLTGETFITVEMERR